MTASPPASRSLRDPSGRSEPARFAVVLWLLVVTAACTAGSPLPVSSSGPSSVPSSSRSTAPSGPTTTDGTVRYDVSIGDSYGAGYRPEAGGGFVTTKDGFAYQVADQLSADGSRIELVNFACAGATSADLLAAKGCAPGHLGPGAANYPNSSQADAALAFLRGHHGAIALITVVIGGNDVIGCVDLSGGRLPADLSRCINDQLSALSARLKPFLGELRSAVGPEVPIVGLTYPDVFLGLYLKGAKDLAQASVSLFRDYVNPTLKSAYGAVAAHFVDVTAAFGGYSSATETKVVAPYGPLPLPVAGVCALTYVCGPTSDIHPTRAGHTVIAQAVLQVLQR